MSALSVQPPYPAFAGTDGQPLEDGYVWIGTANLDPQNNPINVYWDAALTLPAAQPIRTLAGYPANSGTPARLYVNSDYSIRVMNKNGSAVYSAPAATERYSDIVVTGINAQDVVYDPPFLGSVLTNAEAKFAESVSVKDFGAVGDGVANDKAAIALAVATGKAVVFPEGTYYLGEYNSSNDVGIDCSGRTVHFTNIGKVKFTIRTATGIGDCFPTVFRLYNSPNSTFGDFYFEDLNADLSTTNRRGLKAYRMTADGVTGTWGDVSIGRIYCENTINAVAFDGADAVNRVRNITIQEIHLDTCYYGVNAQNQGDNVIVGAIYGNQVRRIYFVYGVQSHRATIFDKNHFGSTSTVYLQRTEGGFDTKDIYINYTCYETSEVQTIVLIQHNDLLGGKIENINLTLNVDVSVSSRPVYFVNLDGAGNETSAASLNVVNEIYINGRFGATAQNILTTASYLTNTGSVYVSAENAVIDTSTTAVKFIVRNKPITYAPVWSTSGTAPALGNGTLTGQYEIVGDICNFFIGFTAGSTTTFGTGAFEFTLPKPAAYDQVVTIWGEDNGTANYIGLGLFGGLPSRSTVYGVSNASGATWAAAAPFAWGSGDRIRISGSYIVQN